jgi:hypothetical protein
MANSSKLLLVILLAGSLISSINNTSLDALVIITLSATLSVIGTVTLGNGVSTSLILGVVNVDETASWLVKGAMAKSAVSTAA